MSILCKIFGHKMPMYNMIYDPFNFDCERCQIEFRYESLPMPKVKPPKNKKIDLKPNV